MSYSIVIPSNNSARLRKCAASIIDCQPALDLKKIIVVDDDACGGWTKDDPKVRWVAGDHPFIYARNVNMGIEAAGTDDVIIVGDDVRLRTPGGFDRLAETAERKNVSAVSPGIIGPVGNQKQVLRTRGAVRESEFALCFVCVYLPRAWLDKVGPLDEQFVHYGSEDLDWCWRAQSIGGRFLINDGCVVGHNERGMESAFRSQAGVEDRAAKALELLRAKWPGKFDENGAVKR